MKNNLLLIGCVLTSTNLMANDWDAIPLPVAPDNGKVWQLQEAYSDSFNYTGKPAAFTSKWNDTYFNSWTGPGLTYWQRDESWVSDGNLIISASRRAGTDQVNAGVITSKTKVTFPIFLEASIKVSNLELSSNFWLLSDNDEREIDVLEVYGGARDEWFARNMSTNFHVFIRDQQTNQIISDYNDQTHNTPSWGTYWREGFHRFGVYWKSPTDVTFYIDGQQTPDGSWAQVVMKDKDYTGATLNKNTHNMDQSAYIIIDTEDHDWRSEAGNIATDADLADDSKNKMYVDWVRVYKPVNAANTSSVTSGAQIKAKHSQKCIDIKNGAMNNGSTYQQWNCNSNNENQAFELVELTNNEYAISSQLTGLCMQIANSSTSNGAGVEQWVCDHTKANQRFTLNNTGDGYFELRSSLSNKCIDIAGKLQTNGASVVQWQCYNGDNQRFQLIE
ncbi:RICIN domain-containing protein [Pseudoalteromonas distincta]|uniref:RICIN domain-containing protein n=1 Tax=Pseudoalteromonas distincta TaxID=77608 RepID=UPI00165FBD9F|nr:RICIN domain-containing protein [Pseudoalteromonas distincta]MBD0411212.1 RICIN domain-containing protein [Pseudoalteromonas distincta]